VGTGRLSRARAMAKNGRVTKLMVKPQCENGRTRIANELLEAWARINLLAYE
jgi:hypothetical protein